MAAGDAHAPTQTPFLPAGFQPAVPYYEIMSSDIPFDLNEVKRALFERSDSSQIVLPLNIDDLVQTGVPFALVVVSVEAVVSFQTYDHAGAAIGYTGEPDWLVRGYLVKSPYEPHPEFTWVVAHIIMDGAKESTVIDRIAVQLLLDGRDGPRPW